MTQEWTTKQEEQLRGIREIADLEMHQALDICRNCHDKFVMAKTYHYVYKKGMIKDIPRQFRGMAAAPVSDKEVWTPEFTEEAIRIAQAGIQRKMDYVREFFAAKYGDDIESYGFKGCTGSAMLMLAICGIGYATLV